MSTITFHAPPGPDGRAAGKPRTGTMSSRDPVVAARLAKNIIQQGKWRSLPGRTDQGKILVAISSEARWAVLALPADVVDVLPAVGKAPPPGGCHWCCALVQRLPDRPEVERNPATLAFLGNGCASCQRRWREAELTAAAIQEEAAHLEMLTAAGGTVASAVRGLERARSIVAKSGGRRAGRD